MLAIHLLLVSFTGLITYLCLRWAYFRHEMHPGPLGLPFIGNSFQLPARKPWIKFSEWSSRYGNLFSIFIGSTPVIVLSDAETAWNVLEKQSEISSSRPRFIMGSEILSDNMRGLMLPYGDRWRRWRRILHAGLSIRKSVGYKGMQAFESKITMRQILETPECYEKHLQRYAASVAASLAYGSRVNDVSDWIVKENMAAMDYLTSVNIPGKYIVESWPWLLRLPHAWQIFRREPEARREKDTKFLMHLLNGVRDRLNAGDSINCMASHALLDQKKSGFTDLEIAYAVSTPFGAGIETTAGTLSVFILAMLHFPSVLKKAQNEVDEIVGSTRLPNFDDQENLPYINALIKETLRWRPVPVLGGTPHATTVDSFYNGRLIPKGSTVYANMYGIMKDPVMFPFPERFDPERFLSSTNPRLNETFNLPFGFGRRQCPGMTLSMNSLFINISRIVWAFDLRPVGGMPDPNNFTDGFNSRPISFPCRFIARRPDVGNVIESEVSVHI